MILQALLAASLNAEPVDLSEARLREIAVEALTTAHWRPRNIRIHSIRVAGQRQIRQGEATLVCVSNTSDLRFGVRDVYTVQPIYLQGERVVWLGDGNLQACAH